MVRRRAAFTTREDRASRARALGRTMSWLNRSDRAHTRSLDKHEPKKMNTTPSTE